MCEDYRVCDGVWLTHFDIKMAVLEDFLVGNLGLKISLIQRVVSLIGLDAVKRTYNGNPGS